MKLLLCYHSKHGSAKALAMRLKEKLHADIVDIHEEFDDSKYTDVVCIGAVYAGMMNKKMKQYLHVSKGKTLYLAIVGIDADNAIVTAEKNLKEDMEKIAFTIGVGGVLDFSKLGFLEKKIIKMVNQRAQFIKEIDSGKRYEMWREEAIEILCERIQQ